MKKKLKKNKNTTNLACEGNGGGEEWCETDNNGDDSGGSDSDRDNTAPQKPKQQCGNETVVTFDQ